MTLNNLYGLDNIGFANFLKDEIPQLFKLQTLRVCFQDDEGAYVYLIVKNYHRFLRLSTHAFKTNAPRINIGTAVNHSAQSATCRWDIQKQVNAILHCFFIHDYFSEKYDVFNLHY